MRSNWSRSASAVPPRGLRLRHAQRGCFLSGLSTGQVARLREEFSVWIDSGRMCMAASLAQRRLLADALRGDRLIGSASAEGFRIGFRLAGAAGCGSQTPIWRRFLLARLFSPSPSWTHRQIRVGRGVLGSGCFLRASCRTAFGDLRRLHPRWCPLRDPATRCPRGTGQRGLGREQRGFCTVPETPAGCTRAEALFTATRSCRQPALGEIDTSPVSSRAEEMFSR